MTKIKHPTEATLKRWTQMTDENDHDAVRIEIARWIQRKRSANIWAGDCLNIYKEIAARSREMGHLSIFDSFARSGADQILLGRINLVDAALAEKIDKCL